MGQTSLACGEGVSIPQADSSSAALYQAAKLVIRFPGDVLLAFHWGLLSRHFEPFSPHSPGLLPCSKVKSPPATQKIFTVPVQ